MCDPHSSEREHYVVVRLDSFDGRDTHLHCGNDEQDYLYCVVAVADDGRGEIVDNGYRSFEEAVDAWPEVVAARKPDDAGRGQAG